MRLRLESVPSNQMGFWAPVRDDGLGAVLNQIAQGRRRIGHGVRAVADDEAVVVVVVLPDGLGRPQPVGGMDAGAVQTIQLDAVHMAQLGDAGEIGQQLVGVQLRCQAPPASSPRRWCRRCRS